MRSAGIIAGPDVTDAAGSPADRRQHERLIARYSWASSLVDGRTVVEVACGTGQGLGLLATRAERVVGADYSMENLLIARKTYGNRIGLLRLDAQKLPFPDAALGGIVLLEALYFLPSDDAFLSEARRCLKPGGRLLISVINRDNPDYHPRSIYYNHYGVRELIAACERHQLVCNVFGSVPLRFSNREQILRPVKKIAMLLDLVPKTNRSRAWLKRFVFGELSPLPTEIPTSAATNPPPKPLDGEVGDKNHQVVLCMATRL